VPKAVAFTNGGIESKSSIKNDNLTDAIATSVGGQSATEFKQASPFLNDTVFLLGGRGGDVARHHEA
jgi:hypothetical protein